MSVHIRTRACHIIAGFLFLVCKGYEVSGARCSLGPDFDCTLPRHPWTCQGWVPQYFSKQWGSCMTRGGYTVAFHPYTAARERDPSSDAYSFYTGIINFGGRVLFSSAYSPDERKGTVRIGLSKHPGPDGDHYTETRLGQEYVLFHDSRNVWLFYHKPGSELLYAMLNPVNRPFYTVSSFETSRGSLLYSDPQGSCTPYRTVNFYGALNDTFTCFECQEFWAKRVGWCVDPKSEAPASPLNSHGVTVPCDSADPTDLSYWELVEEGDESKRHYLGHTLNGWDESDDGVEVSPFDGSLLSVSPAWFKAHGVPRRSKFHIEGLCGGRMARTQPAALLPVEEEVRSTQRTQWLDWNVNAVESKNARAIAVGNHYTQPIYFTPSPKIPDGPGKCSGSFAQGGPCSLLYRQPNFDAVVWAPPVNTGLAAGTLKEGERTPVTISCSPYLSTINRGNTDVYYFYLMHSDGAAEVFAVAYAGQAKSSLNSALVRIGDIESWGNAQDVTHLAYGSRIFPVRDYKIYFNKRSLYMTLDINLGALFPGSTDANVPRIVCGLQRDLVFYAQTNVLSVSATTPRCTPSWIYRPSGICATSVNDVSASCAASSWVFSHPTTPSVTVGYLRRLSGDTLLISASGHFQEYLAEGVSFSSTDDGGTHVLVSRSFFEANNDGVVEGVLAVTFGTVSHEYRMACDNHKTGPFTTGPLDLYGKEDPFPDRSPNTIAASDIQPVYCVRDVTYVSCPARVGRTQDAAFTLWKELDGVKTMMVRVFYSGPGVYNEFGRGVRLLTSERILGPRRVSYTQDYVAGKDYLIFADRTKVWFVVDFGGEYFRPWKSLRYGCDFSDGGASQTYQYDVTVGDSTLSACSPRCDETWTEFLGQCVPQNMPKTTARVVTCTGGLSLQCPQTLSPSESVYWYYLPIGSTVPMFIGNGADVIEGVIPKENGGLYLPNAFIDRYLGGNVKGTFQGLCGLRQVEYSVLISTCVSTITLPPWAQVFVDHKSQAAPAVTTAGSTTAQVDSIVLPAETSEPSWLSVIMLLCMFLTVIIMMGALVFYYYKKKYADASVDDDAKTPILPESSTQ
ncbi:membrane protein ORF115 [Cyprinid herpesvirus 1]|uniref:Membrane protein ORF115 n=1 Tax=Cyprinid herpesvirus 1 TaxID=317858 RepID=K7PCL5_9VIRU|nr:membrane protein ORF115 [Cyprinid herpesvirus 1]AFJ20415.1 membrane protein ORF115 [Cyprinid herpesvirus 1]